MVPNASLVQLIKKIAMEAFYASKPCDIMIGKVNSALPLKIAIGQNLILDEDFLVVTDAVRGRLRTNTKVVLIRHAGGQSFTVMGTIGAWQEE